MREENLDCGWSFPLNTKVLALDIGNNACSQTEVAFAEVCFREEKLMKEYNRRPDEGKFALISFAVHDYSILL